MVMSIIFIMFFIALVYAWLGRRKIALITFGLSLLLGILVFMHHLTSHLTLSL